MRVCTQKRMERIVNAHNQVSASDAACVPYLAKWAGSTFVIQSNVVYGFINGGSTNWGTGLPTNFSASAASALNLTPTPISIPNFGANGATVNLTLYQMSSSTAGKGQAYKGTGTTGFADPGADISKLPLGGAGPPPPPLTPTTTAITAPTSAYPSEVQITVQVQSTVSGLGTPAGAVSFTLSGGPQSLVNEFAGQYQLDTTGKTILTLTWLSPGTYTLNATYGGSTIFAGSTASQTVIVTSGGTTVHLTPTPTNPTAGQQVTVRGRLKRGQTP